MKIVRQLANGVRLGLRNEATLQAFSYFFGCQTAKKLRFLAIFVLFCILFDFFGDLWVKTL